MARRTKRTQSEELSQAAVSRRFAIGTLLSASAALMPARATDLREQSRGIIEASAYGVVADGNSDDAPALMRAIAALSNGAVLRLPSGTIALGTPGWAGILLQRLSHVRIQGNGTTLKWLAQPSQSTAGFGSTGFKLHECQHAVVADIAIDGNGVDCVGLGLDTCTGCTVRAVEAFAHGLPTRKSGAAQFASSKGAHNHWQYCVARDATPGTQVRGFYLGNANSGWGDSDLRIEGCVARRNSATGFAIEAAGLVCINSISENNGGAGFTSSTSSGSPSADHVFQGNIARSNAFHGWQTDVYGPKVERVVLTGNILSDNAFCGAYCYKGANISVVGNVMAGNGRDTGSAAVAIGMCNGVTVAHNHIEGDSVHGICIGFDFPANKVSDVAISNNVCRGTSSKTVWIEAAQADSSLERVVASGNIVSGGSHGIYVGTGASGAVIDQITVMNNVIGQTGVASFFMSDHDVGQSTNVRLIGNSGEEARFNPNVRLLQERGNSWNSR